MSKDRVTRTSMCVGCLEKGMNPNNLPCCMCFRARNKPPEPRGEDGNILRRYSDYYLYPQLKTMPISTGLKNDMNKNNRRGRQ